MSDTYRYHRAIKQGIMQFYELSSCRWGDRTPLEDNNLAEILSVYLKRITP